MPAKKQRQQMIRELISRNVVESQEQLLALLLAEGVETTQSTLSRDLKEIGVVKGPESYRLPAWDDGRRALPRALASVMEAGVVAVDLGGHLVVLRTRAGQGPDLARRLQPLLVPRVAGILADETTVLIVARSKAQARELLGELRKASQAT